MAETAQASSSSSILYPNRTGSNRTGERRNEEEEAIRTLRANLPAEFQPSTLCRRYRTDDTLITVLEAAEPKGFALPLPDAIDVVNRHGVEVVEGAVLRTLAYMAHQPVRKPRAWLLATIHKGLAWKPHQCATYVLREWEKGLEQMEASENATHQRLAKELRLKLGGSPENVTPLARRPQ